MRLKIILILCLAAPLYGCSFNSETSPSVLVIAVDFLGFNDISCDPNIGLNGFSDFCEESIRFTHAYTPSTMSNAALASIFTGKYPIEHKVWHNGNTSLSAKIETVPEVALKNKFHTSFISGGPPVWSKSGINQGFEYFNDNVDVELNHFYRPAMDNFKLFLNWLDSDSYKESFFSTIYLADLQFPDITTRNDANEERSRTRDSQLREIDESLSYLIKELKRRNRWNSTYVVLVGLNGPPQPTDEIENSAYSLSQHSCQLTY
ncbi:MAG: sulfatase-like hydrolase/transferase [Bdellovibrionales bacterium]